MSFHDPDDHHITLMDMKSLKAEPEWLRDDPDQEVKKFYLHLGLHKTDNPLFNVDGLYGISQLETAGKLTFTQTLLQTRCS